MRRAQARGGGTATKGNKSVAAGRNTKVIERDGNDPSQDPDEGG